MRRTRRGNVAVMVAVGLMVLLGVAALVIDLGYARYVQAQLQNAADAAAMAGAMRLDGTDEGVAAARATAAEIAALNIAAGDGVALDENDGNDAAGDIVLGSWDADAGAFVPSTDPGEANAVQVRARVPSLALLVAPMALGLDTTPVGAATTAFAARGGAQAVDCFIPLGMPACLVDRYTVDGLQDITLKLNPPGIDNVGWARPNGSPNAAWSRDQLTDCQYSGEAAIGDPLGLQNGVVTSVLSEVVTAVEASSTTWDTAKWGAIPAQDGQSSISAAKYGRTFEGVVPVFDGGTSYCNGSGGSFSGSAPISGFVWGAIYDVVNKGAAGNRTLKMRLDVSEDRDAGTDVGGPDWAVEATEPPRMVHPS